MPSPADLRLWALLAGIVCLGVPAHAMEVGAPAPPFTLPALDGDAETETTVALADLAGQVVLLDFWAVVVRAVPRRAAVLYSGLHRELSDEGLVVLAVNVDEHVEDAHRFLEGRALLQPMVRDVGLGRSAGATASPCCPRRWLNRPAWHRAAGATSGFDDDYAEHTPPRGWLETPWRSLLRLRRTDTLAGGTDPAGRRR